MAMTTTAVAIIAAGASAAAAYQQGQEQRTAIKQQYKVDEYNAQMEKMETEVDLARQEKELQKQLAYSMAEQNNLFGESGLEGSTGDLLQGTYERGLVETQSIKAQERYAQNKYISTEAIRRKNFNKNLKNNAISTGLNMVSSGISTYSAAGGKFGGSSTSKTTTGGK